MADVTTWSPTDDANAFPPPDGWPEFMMPSMVNNSARAMMGAVRRMYDSLVGGTMVLPYLPIAGGTVHGSVTVTGTVTTGTVIASGNISGAAITASGSITASGNISGGSISTTGTVTANGVTANAVNSNGGVYGASYEMSGSHLATWSGGTTQLYDRANTVCIGLDNSVGLSTYSNNQHDFNGRGGSPNWVQINSAGITVASGGVTVNGTGGVAINSGNLTVSGDIIGEGNRIWCGPVGGQMALIRDPGASRNYLQLLAGWGLVLVTSSGRASWNGPPGQEMWVMEGPCYANQSYVGGHGAYVDFSDIRLKDPDSIAPATVGLAEVLKLKPVTFTRLKRAIDNDLVKYPSPQQELGFVAQDVAEALPHAVIAAELPDGPALGVTSGAIVAALVGAVKTIDQRLTAGGL